MLSSFEDVDLTKKVTGTAGRKRNIAHTSDEVWAILHLQVVLLCLSRIVNQFPHRKRQLQHTYL
jgi:hypothetical protein